MCTLLAALASLWAANFGARAIIDVFGLCAYFAKMVRKNGHKQIKCFMKDVETEGDRAIYFSCSTSANPAVDTVD